MERSHVALALEARDLVAPAVVEGALREMGSLVVDAVEHVVRSSPIHIQVAGLLQGGSHEDNRCR